MLQWLEFQSPRSRGGFCDTMALKAKVSSGGAFQSPRSRGGFCDRDRRALASRRLKHLKVSIPSVVGAVSATPCTMRACTAIAHVKHRLQSPRSRGRFLRLFKSLATVGSSYRSLFQSPRSRGGFCDSTEDTVIDSCDPYGFQSPRSRGGFCDLAYLDESPRSQRWRGSSFNPPRSRGEFLRPDRPTLDSRQQRSSGFNPLRSRGGGFCDPGGSVVSSTGPVVRFQSPRSRGGFLRLNSKDNTRGVTRSRFQSPRSRGGFCDSSLRM